MLRVKAFSYRKVGVLQPGRGSHHPPTGELMSPLSRCVGIREEWGQGVRVAHMGGEMDVYREALCWSPVEG